MLAIYTFSTECPVEEFEVPASSSSGRGSLAGGGRTMGYSTVSHFNLVHVDCHAAAVRQMRGRDEWESAALQNANTRCNGLLPVWGPGVPESSFASALARHNTYLSEIARHHRVADVGYQSTVHDAKLLLLRFARDASFSDKSGGGGPQSNMHLFPYLLHMGLYVLNTTRSAPREDRNLAAFMEQPRERWLESCYAAEGPVYYAVMAMLVAPPKKWKRMRLRVLQRLILAAHCRAVHPARPPRALGDRAVKEYDTYKQLVLFFALVDQIYDQILGLVPVSASASDSTWPSALADWIRNNDDTIQKTTAKILRTFQVK